MGVCKNVIAEDLTFGIEFLVYGIRVVICSRLHVIMHYMLLVGGRLGRGS